MAKPIAATPALTGRDAEAVRRELEQGTRMTPARRQVLEEAKANFARHRGAFEREFRMKDPDTDR